MLECLVNGEIGGYLPVTDRGLAYGDGLFETIGVHRGQPRWWQDHMDRMAAGCERLGLPMPPQAVLLREAQTVSAGQQRCVVKIILTRGPGGRGYLPRAGAEPTRIVAAHAFPENLETQARLGVQARSCELRLAIQPRLGGIKHLNRLEQVLAAAETAQAGAEEGILLDADGHVICAISANLFLVSGGQLLTPRLDRCGVRGVLRARILSAFKSRCELRRISRDMLPEADEAFTCSAIRGIVPLRRIDDQAFTIGPVTRELQAWLEQATA